MNQQINPELRRALDAAATLSDAQQEALAEEILARVGELSESCLSAEQRSELSTRMSEPARYADPKAVQQLFARYGVPG